MPIIDVNAGQDLQAAINNANPGDTLRLEAGGTWQSDFLFPSKVEGGVTLTCADDKLPAQGNRVTEEQSKAMPRIVGHLKTNPKSSYYTLRGLRIEAYPNYYTGGLVDLGGQGINGDIVVREESELPRDWNVDSCFLQADPQSGGKRGIAANCGRLSVADSVIRGFWSDFQDTQAIGGWNGTGPFHIENCLLEGSGENVMFGGACPAIPNLVPSDITVTHCWLYKPEAWKGNITRMRPSRKRQVPRLLKSVPMVKNLFELKNARKVRVDSCIMEGCWTSAQAGFAVQLTVRTCEAGNYDWATVSDVLIDQCLIVSENGINILGTDGNRGYCPDPPYAGTCENIAITRSEIQASWCYQILSGATGIRIDQTTCNTNSGAWLAFDTMADVREMTGLVVRNNLATFGSGIIGTNAGPGTQALDAFWDEWQVEHNALWAVPASELWWITQPQWYPQPNLYVTEQSEVPEGEYGCDPTALAAKLANVRTGQRGQPPSSRATLVVHSALPPGEYQLT
jgi:hypothetical protein